MVYSHCLPHTKSKEYSQERKLCGEPQLRMFRNKDHTYKHNGMESEYRYQEYTRNEKEK